jgi:hypothetical protein
MPNLRLAVTEALAKCRLEQTDQIVAMLIALRVFNSMSLGCVIGQLFPLVSSTGNYIFGEVFSASQPRSMARSTRH